jgi:hypothetical protein
MFGEEIILLIILFSYFVGTFFMDYFHQFYKFLK